jgi:hypothetical protein
MAKPKAKSKTDSDGYPLAPVNVNERLWLYLEKDGVTVCAEERDLTGKHLHTAQADVPWSVLCSAVDLHRKLSK